MAYLTPADDDLPEQVARLRRFLGWLISVDFGFVLLLAVAGVLLRHAPLAIVGGILFAFGLLVVGVYSKLRQDNLETAVIIICGGLFAMIVLLKLFEALSSATLAITPLLAVMIALPYLRQRVLGRLMIVAWLMALIISLLNEFTAPVTVLPFWVSVGFRVGSYVAVVALLLLLLWQFNHWLLDILGQLQAANAALRESEGRYRSVSEMTSDAIYSFRATPDGEFALEWANDRLARLTGYTPEELRAPGAWRAMLEGLPESLEELTSRLDTRGTGVVEVPFRTKSGELRWVRNYFRIERDADGERIVRILEAAQDITERKQAEADHRALERRLQEAQKLESLAVLAGGIAHDFNNLLAIILGSADLARMELPPDSPARELLAPITVAVKRAGALTQQMLAYSGKGHFLIDQIDINALLREMHEPLRIAVGDRATAIYQLAPQLPPIQADSSQIRQLVLNLVINATEAIEQPSGVITISTSARHIDRTFLAQTYLAPELPEGHYVALEVADTGSGMDQATLARIFEPFFTTRFTGRGLGLAAVLGIVRGHHGAVHVWSAPGRGTHFTVLLPAANSEARAMDEPPGQPALKPIDPGPSPGLVLIVDDEEAIRIIAARILEQSGFSVLTAADSQSALALFQSHSAGIACVLLDLTMPGAGGDTTLQEIRRIKPDACVILMSGYDEREATDRFADQRPNGFLQKPFSPEQLHETLRRVLGQS